MKQASFVLPPLANTPQVAPIIPSKNENKNESEERRKPIKIVENIYRL
jgi:hypothetical protein